ncbi:hypothetical protein DKX38_005080 [Salix brachista]|uniref:CFA20 domain-containing protein n=1 Tax=Salix brachista TaxID=2182728 RepID=A0A5N5NF10_9ROSI|nr:hypothetical protein DKX38_005080 [Salix brachista]
MFKNTFQSGFLSILYSLGSKPLQIWDKEVSNGHIKRLHDEDIQSNVLEIVGSNIQSTYITCPADPGATLGIKLPFLVVIVKNVKKYFTFEIQVLDDKNVRRRFRASNFQVYRCVDLKYLEKTVTRVKPYICTMPLKLDEGWNQIQLNLADFTRRAYGTNYVETLRVQVHANCRLRRIYFSDRLYSEEELPPEFKLYLPVQQVRIPGALSAATFKLPSLSWWFASHCSFDVLIAEIVRSSWLWSYCCSTRISRSFFTTQSVYRICFCFVTIRAESYQNFRTYLPGGLTSKRLVWASF